MYSGYRATWESLETITFANTGVALPQPDVGVPLSTASGCSNQQLLKKNHCRKEMDPSFWRSTTATNISMGDFRLPIGHDYLQTHHYRIGVADYDLWPLCERGRQDSDHLRLCPVQSRIVPQHERTSTCPILLVCNASNDHTIMDGRWIKKKMI